MTKRTLVNAIAAQAGLSKVQTAKVVQLWMDELMNEVARSGRVELRGFGVFTVHDQGGYTTVSPRTGETIDVAPHRQVHFKAGKHFKAKLNDP